MAFQWKTFQTRTKTAIIFAAVMLTGLLWNQWSLLILFTIIHFGCWWEYLTIAEKIYNTSIDKRLKYIICVVGFAFMLSIGLQPHSFNTYSDLLSEEYKIKWIILLSLFLCLYVLLSVKRNISGNLKWFVSAGLFYISLSLGLILTLNESIVLNFANYLPYSLPYSGYNPTGFKYHLGMPLLIIAAIWINDTMAYIIGSLIGKTPLSKVSPKKTWEGTIGGILLTIGCAVIVAIISDFEIFSFALITFICVVAGTFGDLFESKLKRMANLKDSGSFMPGHGGFLDRFDSMLFAIPAVWAFYYLAWHMLVF